MTASNPLLRGFMPDPSAIRVGDDYFVANSSFEWYPMIPIHRSRDLVNWSFAGALADDALDLRGIPSSEGIWAPSLSFANGRFWLVFTVVRSMEGMRTYVTRADSVDRWEPLTRVPTTGFDPSLFHQDGRLWLLNMRWDHRPDRESFAGITLQELDATTLAPLGEARLIHRGDTLLEGPNLYWRDGWYWLTLAEGGTGWEHGIATLRSRTIDGPYAPDPSGPLITTRDAPAHPLQKAGHGELIDTSEGAPYLVHLGSRVTDTGDARRSLFGRETLIEPIEYDADGWPRIAGGGTVPVTELDLPSRTGEVEATGFALGWPWSSLRQGADASWAQIGHGALVLRGRDGLDSLFEQSLLARRIREPHLRFSVAVDALPHSPAHAAGIVVWYDTGTWAQLALTADYPEEASARVLTLNVRDSGDDAREVARVPAPEGEVVLTVELRDDELHFILGEQPIAEPVPFALFSDDRGELLRFTGPMVGVSAIDQLEGSWTARFELREFSERA